FDGSDVDDSAEASAPEVARRRLRVAESALEVGVEDELPMLLRHLPQRRVRGRARGVDEEVESPQTPQRLLDDLRGARVLAHVRAERYHAPARALQQILDLRELRLSRHVNKGHVRARARQLP